MDCLNIQPGKEEPSPDNVRCFTLFMSTEASENKSISLIQKDNKAVIRITSH